MAPVAEFRPRTRSTHVPVQLQDSGLDHHLPDQQQRAQHPAGPLFLRPCHGLLQPGLPVELEGHLPLAGHARRRLPTRDGRSSQQSLAPARCPPQVGALHGLPLLSPRARFWSGLPRVYPHHAHGEMAPERVLPRNTLHWRRLPSHLHSALRLHHQSGPLGRLSRKHRHAGPAPDRLHGRALSPRHPHDDRGRRHHQYRLDLCLAPARRPPHRLSPDALPARHHPLRRGRSCRHGRHGMDHLPACQSLATAPLAHRPGCRALLCRHAPGGRRDPAGVYGLPPA